MNKVRLCMIVVLSVVMVTSFGCESFRKKFIRKKRRKIKEETMVIVPRDYSKEQLSSDQAYQRYYMYWRAWHRELHVHLHEGASRKKIISCFEQTLLNLNRMRKLLADEEKVEALQGYIDGVQELEAKVQEKRFRMLSFSQLKHSSERLFRDIQRGFAFRKIEADLK